MPAWHYRCTHYILPLPAASPHSAWTCSAGAPVQHGLPLHTWALGLHLGSQAHWRTTLLSGTIMFHGGLFTWALLYTCSIPLQSRLPLLLPAASLSALHLNTCAAGLFLLPGPHCKFLPAEHTGVPAILGYFCWRLPFYGAALFCHLGCHHLLEGLGLNLEDTYCCFACYRYYFAVTEPPALPACCLTILLPALPYTCSGGMGACSYNYCTSCRCLLNTACLPYIAQTFLAPRCRCHTAVIGSGCCLPLGSLLNRIPATCQH